MKVDKWDFRLYTVKWYRVRKDGRKDIQKTFIRSDVSGNAKCALQSMIAWEEGLEPGEVAIVSYRRSPKGV